MPPLLLSFPPNLLSIKPSLFSHFTSLSRLSLSLSLSKTEEESSCLSLVKMQNDAVYGDFTTTTTPSLQDYQNGLVLTNSLYSSSIFPPYADSVYDSRPLMQQQQQQQDIVNHHNLCLTRLRESASETEALRQENAALRSVNRELNKQLSLMIQASVQKHFASSDYRDTTPFEIVNLLRGMCVGGGGDDDEEEEVCKEEESVDTERVSLPKSISVRSNGYLKMSQTRPQIPSPLTGKQKVYVRGTKKEEEPLELEVYNQGMSKTELCNKWQETGACPYGDHCQFAHGISELRPVIRHPRYKTQVCKMVLGGGICPYGHRCHFRHALTDQERFMGHLKPRAINLN